MSHILDRDNFDNEKLTEFDVFGLDFFDEDNNDEDNESESSLPAGAPESHVRVDDSLLIKPETIINNKKLYVATSFVEYENYVVTNYMQNKNYLQHKAIAYDIETNAEDPKSVNAKIIGFSNAFSDESGIYVVRESLDFVMPDDEWKQVLDLFTLLMTKSNKIIVHNSKYETPYTINCLNYELKNSVVEDTLIKCRVLYPGEPAGLKPASARLLNYADWDYELAMFTKASKAIIGDLVDLLALKRLNNDRQSDFRFYQNILLKNAYTTATDIYTSLVDGTYLPTQLIMNFMSILQVFSYNELLNDTMLILLIDKIMEIVNDGGLDTGVIPYSMIPMKIISKYGAIDAVATFELNTYCDNKFDEKNNEIKSLLRRITNDDSFDYFDLRKGYEVVKAQFNAGINLEMAGARWDDVVAQHEYDFYNNMAIDSWFGLFKNEKFTDAIKERYRETVIRDIVSAGLLRMYEMQEDAITRKLDTLISQFSTYKLQKSQITFFDIIIDKGLTGTPLVLKFSKVYSHFKESFDKIFNEEFEDAFSEILTRDNVTDYTVLTQIYNPGKQGAEDYELIDSILNSNDLKIAYLYELVTKQALENRYWERFDFPGIGAAGTMNLYTYMDYVKKYNDEAKLKKEKPLNRKEVIEKFKQLIAKVDVRYDNVFGELVDSAFNFKITSVKDDVVISLFEKYLILGLNPDDRSTWSSGFEWLFNFRIYKKSVKMITTYLKGTVGRKSVKVVDKNTVSDLLPRRLRSYDEGEFNPELEEHLLTVDFGVCTAETGRWRSGIHTIPAGATIKNIYRSRYEGGIICAPDYSQMEVRAIAASAKEEIMLETFYSGQDIHLRTAVSVYKKPQEEITANERRFSKAVTFAVLFGASEHNIAKNFMNNDMQAAKVLLDNFYVGYPRLKIWVDAMHALWKQTGYVPLLSNRLIKITIPERYDPKFNFKMSKGFRCAQNYPIQGLSNDVAGYVLFLLIEYIKEQNFKSKAISYVHDALYFDIHPSELFDMTSAIDSKMNNYPTEAYRLPAVAELVIGASMGQELKVKEMTRISQNSGTFTVSGYEDEFDELITTWKKVYKIVEWEDITDPEVKFFSNATIFAPKTAMTPFLGKHRTEIVRKIFIEIA